MLSLAASTTLGELQIEARLETAAGAPLVLAGPSGAGKTTLLRIAAGLTRPARGHVACGDEIWLDTQRGIDVAPEQRRCGLVFQDRALFPHLSAWRNVAYGARRGDRRQAAIRLLERFGLANRADALPAELSGGERQRVALARTLAAEPQALLLDEPLAALDARTRARAGRELAALIPDLGVPAIVVTHNFEEAALMGRDVAVLDSGRILQRGTPSELASSPASGFVADFTGAVVISGRARPGSGGLTEVELDGGGAVNSTDVGRGPVAVSVHPWEIALEPAEHEELGSLLNRLPARVVSVTAIGNRTRVGMTAPQPLTAEITTASAERMALAPGDRTLAVWKAAATRLAPL
jgi:molybdate transport system ATP-binding protein